MDFFKTLISSIEQQDAEVDRIVTEAESLFEQMSPSPSLGLRPKMRGPDRNVPVRKGDVIVDATNDNRLVVATGEFQDDKPIVKAQDGSTGVLEPEFVLMGIAVDNPAIQRAAKKLATTYPSRRILAYGLSPAANPLGESKCETTSDGSTVHNDAHPWTTFIDAAKKDPTVKEPKKNKKGKK